MVARVAGYEEAAVTGVLDVSVDSVMAVVTGVLDIPIDSVTRIVAGVSDVSVELMAAGTMEAAALAALMAADLRMLDRRPSGTASRLFLPFSSFFFFASAFMRWKRGDEEEGAAALVVGRWMRGDEEGGPADLVVGAMASVTVDLIERMITLGVAY